MALSLFTKIYFKSLPKKIIHESYNLASGAAILKIQIFLHTETDQITPKKKKRPIFKFQIGNFLGEIGKKEDILDWEWAEYRTLVIGRKGPANTGFPWLKTLLNQ